MWFHFIQVPLIGLIALAVYLLTEGLQGRAVMVSRWAIGVFAVFFSAYDAAAGIGTGYALRNARGLSAGAQEAIYEAVKDMPVVSLIFVLSVVGSLAWVVALVCAAMALRRAGASLGPFILLILAGVFFWEDIPTRPARWPSGRSSWPLCGWSSHLEVSLLLADPCVREPNFREYPFHALR